MQLAEDHGKEGVVGLFFTDLGSESRVVASCAAPQSNSAHLGGVSYEGAVAAAEQAVSDQEKDAT